jgi:arginine repressor
MDLSYQKMDRIGCQYIAEYLTRIVSSTESKTKDIFHQNSLHFFQAMFTHAMRNQSQIYLHINPGGAQLNTILISISW